CPFPASRLTTPKTSSPASCAAKSPASACTRTPTRWPSTTSPRRPRCMCWWCPRASGAAPRTSTPAPRRRRSRASGAPWRWWRGNSAWRRTATASCPTWGRTPGRRWGTSTSTSSAAGAWGGWCRGPRP
ncbi:MAG: Bis(5'-nucleosyl)-tetraphosphatase (asymmetrical), partial [uncultured Acetobacteraceae bacterium]